MKRLLLTAALGLAVGSASLHADFAPDGALVTLMTWDLTGAAGTQESNSGNSVYEDSVTAKDLVRGAGLTGTMGANSMNTSGWTGQDTDYFEFGLTVLAGSLDLSQLTIATRSSAYGPGQVGLFTSVDGFTTAIHTFNQAAGGNYVNSIVDLAAVTALQDITGELNFRLKQIGTTAANGSLSTSAGTFRISEYASGSTYTDLTLTGSVTAIPEPSTYAMILGGLTLGLAALRRRRA